MSSDSWPVTKLLGGIFESNAYKSPLAGANFAYVPYCTSDAYIGDADANTTDVGWSFRGSHFVPTVIAALTTQHGMGTTGGPERLLLSGCASGAWGAIFNVDYASAWVPPTVQIHGLFDAGLSVDIVPMATGLAMPLQEQTLAVLKLTNGTSRLWPPCVSNYPGADVAWKCVFPQYRVPFIKVGYLLAAPLYDSVQLRANEGGAAPPYAAGSTAAAYAQAFGALSRKVAEALPNHDQNGAAVFAPACYLSCLTVDAAFWTVRAGAL
jgi:hypothetical protein